MGTLAMPSKTSFAISVIRMSVFFIQTMNPHDFGDLLSFLVEPVSGSKLLLRLKCLDGFP